MVKRSDFARYAGRMGVCFAIALVFVVVISEVAFVSQRQANDRQPQTVELVIPAGTAQQIAAGESNSAIPAELTLVLGDTLLVRNEDRVDHQIGPVWVPPGLSASLEMEQPDKYVYSCSFRPSRYLGLDVREPTTLGTRLTALGLAVPPTTMFLFFYSLLLVPVRKPEDKLAQPAGAPDPAVLGAPDSRS
jgi:hypothetical protein